MLTWAPSRWKPTTKTGSPTSHFPTFYYSPFSFDYFTCLLPEMEARKTSPRAKPKSHRTAFIKSTEGRKFLARMACSAFIARSVCFASLTTVQRLWIGSTTPETRHRDRKESVFQLLPVSASANFSPATSLVANEQQRPETQKNIQGPASEQFKGTQTTQMIRSETNCISQGMFGAIA